MAITLMVVIFATVVAVFWLPVMDKIIENYQQNQSSFNTIQGLKLEINGFKKRVGIDVNAPYKEQVRNLKKQIRAQDKKVESLTSALITPRNMGQVFNGLLKVNEINMNKISNLDAEKVKINTEKEETNLLFKHGLSLELQGEYLKALKYVQQIEAQDWQLYWDELSFTTLKYPQGRLNIEVHTLSTSDSVLDL
jgi:MSHA biogenesis protein MshJ